MTIDISKADIVFLTNATHDSLHVKPRFHMYADECRRIGLSLATLSMVEDVEKTPGTDFAVADMHLWKRNLKLYDRLFENERALIISDGVGSHAFGLIMTQAWRANRVLLDYSSYDIYEPQSGYTSIDEFFPSFAAPNLLGAVARSAVMCVAASKSLHDFLVDHTRHVSLLPTGYAANLFPVRQPRAKSPIKLAWLGSINTLDDAKEPLLAIELLNHLPAEMQAQIELHIIGDGSLWKSIPDHVESTTFPCYFHNRPDDAALAALLGEMSIGLCLPANAGESILREGRDCLAMMMAGVAVCTLKQGESGRLVKDGDTGCVCATLDEFRQALEKLVTHHHKRELFGTSAAKQARADYAFGFEGCKLGSIIEAAYAGDPNQRYDACITPDSHPHLFAA